MNIRLNKDLRAYITQAVIDHGFAARIEALDNEFRAVRDALMRHNYTDKQIKAMQTLAPVFKDHFAGVVQVNCGGPNIVLQPINRRSALGEKYTRDVLTDADLPLLGKRGWGESQRIDLEAEHPLAKRALAYAELAAELNKDRDNQAYRVRATLDTFSSVDDMRRAWPDIMPIAMKVIEARRPDAAPKPKLPALPIAELNASLGLPPEEEKLAA